MFITFSTKAYQNVSYLEPIALQLLNFMGLRAVVPGALTAQELPAALTALQKICHQTPTLKPQEDEEDEQDISVSRRAVPLIALLKAAIAENSSAMWERSRMI